jgi:hypothetical protein
MELDAWARGFQPEQATTEEQSLIAEGASPSVGRAPSLPAPETPGSYSDDSEPDATDDLLWSLRRLCIRPNPRRYFGKSSGISLLRTAMTVKPKASGGESMGLEPETHAQRRDEFWRLHPVSF